MARRQGFAAPVAAIPESLKPLPPAHSPRCDSDSSVAGLLRVSDSPLTCSRSITSPAMLRPSTRINTAIALGRQPASGLLGVRRASMGRPQSLQISLLGPRREGDTSRQPHWGHGMRSAVQALNASPFPGLSAIDCCWLLACDGRRESTALLGADPCR